MNEIDSLLPQITAILQAAISLGIAIMLFTLGRAIVSAVAADKPYTDEDFDEQWAELQDGLQDDSKFEYNVENLRDNGHEDIADAWEAGEIDHEDVESLVESRHE